MSTPAGGVSYGARKQCRVLEEEVVEVMVEEMVEVVVVEMVEVVVVEMVEVVVVEMVEVVVVEMVEEVVVEMVEVVVHLAARRLRGARYDVVRAAVYIRQRLRHRVDRVGALHAVGERAAEADGGQVHVLELFRLPHVGWRNGLE
jgi:hypothetical protein